MVKIHFYKAKGDFSDKVIRWWTRSLYSHVELEIDGIWYSISPRDNRVRIKAIWKKPYYWDTILVPANDEQKQKIIDFFNSQLGKKYDYLGIFLSQVISLNIEDPNRWFCSEIVTESLKRANLIEIIKPSNWFSPERLFELLAKEVEEVDNDANIG